MGSRAVGPPQQLRQPIPSQYAVIGGAWVPDAAAAVNHASVNALHLPRGDGCQSDLRTVEADEGVAVPHLRGDAAKDLPSTQRRSEQEAHSRFCPRRSDGSMSLVGGVMPDSRRDVGRGQRRSGGSSNPKGDVEVLPLFFFDA